MHDQPASDPDIVYPSTAAFLSVHLACFAALITGVIKQALIDGIVLYWVRIFSIGAGYHRYFAHRSFKTSRLFQFCLALLSQTSAQCGVLWWAEKHRQHHRYSDTDRDVHSPRRHGLLYAHIGWIFAPQHAETDYRAVRDLYRFLSCGGWTDGRVRADVVQVAADVSGLVSEVLVHDNQAVKRGQVLFRIDPVRFQIALRDAQASVDSKLGAAQEAERETNRYNQLNALSVSQEQQQQRSTTAAEAGAAYQQALASRNLAALNLARSEVRAPVNGFVTNFNMRSGDYVDAGRCSP